MLEQLAVQERIGVEPAPAAREAALSRGMRVLASATELPADSVDTVVSNHALEHTLTPVQALRDIRNLLNSTFAFLRA